MSFNITSRSLTSPSPSITALPNAAHDVSLTVLNQVRARPARWNVVSVLVPLVGLLCGPLLGIVVFHVLKHGSYHPMEMAWPAIVGWLAFCGCGVVAAGIGMLRSERLWGITAFGFILSALPLVVCAANLFNDLLSATSNLDYVNKFGPNGYSPSLIADIRSGLFHDLLLLFVLLLPFVPAVVASIGRSSRRRLNRALPVGMLSAPPG